MVTKKSKKSSEVKNIFDAFPETKEDIHVLANDLIKWAKQDDTLNFDDFALDRFFLPDELYKLTESNDYFSKVYNMALRIVGSRLERLALMGKLDKQLVLATMPLYSPEYRKWLLKLKLKEEIKGDGRAIINYIVDCMYCTPECEKTKSLLKK